MDKLKRVLKRLPIYLLILALAGYGVKQFVDQNKPPEVLPAMPTEALTEQAPSEIQLTNVIALGDAFEYRPRHGEGHFLFRVTGARVVQDASECPPKEQFSEYEEFREDVESPSPYEEWFAEGGPYSRGCRIVLVDLEMTNVDFVGWIHDGTYTPESGYFKDPYVIQPNTPIQLADLSRSYGYGDHHEYYCAYFSEMGKYGEDDLETMGSEHWAMRILPGQTVKCVLGFLVEGKDGKPRDMSMLRVILEANSDAETGVFIELGLENGEG